MPQKIFDNDLVAIQKSKITLPLNKPPYVDMCLLYLGKVLMYEFHYDYSKNKYGNKSRLLFTDVDSLIYEIKTEADFHANVHADFSKDKKMFDFNNYLAKSKFMMIETSQWLLK